ncbi:MAG: hypothetical protein LBE97_02395 [Holosporales bacterium]|jgi:23S rRNA-/tRNA-specific pseudouridylate synthase|nr:hypothetical protein [Holosporales bacterium]
MIIHITEEFIGERIDIVIAKVFKDFSRSQIQKLIKDGAISQNGIPINNIAKKF